MTTIDLNRSYKLLDSISDACILINQALTEHLETTTNREYKVDIEKDIVTLRNLGLIMSAVKADIENDKVGDSTELILRIAANDFKNKLARIPDKKSVRNEIIQSLNEVHRDVLELKILNITNNLNT